MPGLIDRLVANRKPGRIFEWYAHSNALGWAAVLALPGDSLQSSGFRSLWLQGWSEVMLAAALTLVGAVGCMALWANGAKPRGSPRFRSLAAAGGIVLYSQLFASLISDYFVSGIFRFGLVTYGLMAVFCVYACYQSARDARPFA